MVTVFKEACPYCGQTTINDTKGLNTDARLLCGCSRAKKYREIRGSLANVSTNAAPMQEIAEEAMDWLCEAAHLMCMYKIERAAVDLGDGTKVVISGKVSRSVRLKVEEKVDE